MPRSKKASQPEEAPVPAPAPKEGDIVPEGDFAGMSADDVLQLTTQAIYEELGDLTIEHAAMTLDVVVGEFLDKSRAYVGPGWAKECAVRYVETCMPYLREELPEEEQTTAALKLGEK